MGNECQCINQDVHEREGEIEVTMDQLIMPPEKGSSKWNRKSVIEKELPSAQKSSQRLADLLNYNVECVDTDKSRSRGQSRGGP